MVLTLLFGLGASLGLMAIAWATTSLALDNIGLIDVFWGLGFVVVSGAYWLIDGSGTARSALVLACVSLWGLRLGVHLARRNIGEPEDYRYAAMRAKHGAAFRYRSLLTVFLLQGILLWVVSWPLAEGITSGSPDGLAVLDYLAVLVFAIGFLIEAVADIQLTRFRADPANAGRVLDTGLWRYSRHPNYFGDAVAWWGFFLFALAAGGWWTIVSPLVMTVMLLKISGVPLLEKRQRETKPAYSEYARRTSAFIPLPRRQD